MAVKKRKVVQDPRQLDVTELAKYLKFLKEHIHYISPEELIKNCQDIIKCLAQSQEPHENTWEPLLVVEDFLLHVMNSVQEEFRHEIITAILENFNQYITDPLSNVSPATSVVLVVVNFDNEATQSTARWLVQQGEGQDGAGLHSSLSCLYNWVFSWSGSPFMGDWVMAFIKAMQENERFDILIEVSVDNLGNLFSAMDEPVALPQASADVIFHVLSSLRESEEALNVVSSHVERVLNNLASDSGQFSRQLLQNTVDILTEMVNGLGNLSNDTLAFKTKFWDVILCLERHMASRGCSFLQLPPWRTRNDAAKPNNSCQAYRKVGLRNLGNTCYMNSVIQALLLTRHFSSHVMLKMSSVPYWSNMGVLFAKMLHSLSDKLDPKDFFKAFKPPFFTTNSQHDSSEFLGYLFQLLHTFEHFTEDYSKHALPNPLQYMSPARGSSTQSTSAVVSEVDSTEPGPNRRSVSPRPGGSGSGPSSSSSYKRPAKSETFSQKKRNRMAEPALPRESFIDNLFGGVLLTRLKCTECNSSSHSRDVFRDLQLAFPDQPEDFKYSVQNLLEYFCSKEILTGDNKYRCSECGVLRDAERSVLIETTPKYLILVLKNFKFEPKLQKQTKLMHKLDHNFTITLPTVRSQAALSTYGLYAAIVHSGTSLDSGHYYTYAKDKNTWHLYNDDIVTVASGTDMTQLQRRCTPYVLFYRRTDVEEGTTPAFNELPPILQEYVMSVDKEQDNPQHRFGCP